MNDDFGDLFEAVEYNSIIKNNLYNNMNMKKEIPAYVLFIIAVVSYGLSYLLGGIIGDSFGLLGLICLLLSIVRFIRELSNKRKAKADNNNPKQ